MQSTEIAKTTILSPLRLPFRHIGKLFEFKYLSVGIDWVDELVVHPTEVLLDALTGHDVKAGASRIRLVEIGEMAGPTIALPAAALRSSGLELCGSGGGSIPHSAPRA